MKVGRGETEQTLGLGIQLFLWVEFVPFGDGVLRYFTLVILVWVTLSQLLDCLTLCLSFSPSLSL